MRNQIETDNWEWNVFSRECVWATRGEISRRTCLYGSQCSKCEFDQMMTDLEMVSTPANRNFSEQTIHASQPKLALNVGK